MNDFGIIRCYCGFRNPWTYCRQSTPVRCPCCNSLIAIVGPDTITAYCDDGHVLLSKPMTTLSGRSEPETLPLMEAAEVAQWGEAEELSSDHLSSDEFYLPKEETSGLLF